jgi:hypothetical protein
MLSYMMKGDIYGTTFLSQIESLVEVNTSVKRDVVDFGRYIAPLRYYSPEAKEKYISAHQETVQGLCDQFRGIGRIMGKRFLEKSLFHNLNNVKSDIILILDCNDFTRINEIILRGGIVIDIVPKNEKPFEDSWNNLLKVVLTYNGSKKDMERVLSEYFSGLNLLNENYIKQRAYIG